MSTPAGERFPVAIDGFPLTVDLFGREVLLVGAGPVSVRRADALLGSGALLTVVAPRVHPGMTALAGQSGRLVTIHERTFRETDLDGPWLVHIATGLPQVDREIAEQCTRRRLWCVVAGAAEAGSVRVPARTAVSTPAGSVRIAIDSGDPRRSVRVGRHVARSLATAPAGLRARRRQAEGWVALVGGCGDGDLLTVRACRLVHAADVLVVDGAVDPRLAAELDDDVEIVELNDPTPHHVAALVSLRCAAGLAVVRIVGATRLTAEADALSGSGLAIDVVPGVIQGGA